MASSVLVSVLGLRVVLGLGLPVIANVVTGLLHRRTLHSMMAEILLVRVAS